MFLATTVLFVAVAAPCQSPVLYFRDGRQVCPDRPAVYAFGLVTYEVDGRARQVPQNQVDVERSRPAADTAPAPARRGSFTVVSGEGTGAPCGEVSLGFLAERIAPALPPPPVESRNRDEEAREELARKRYERLRQNAAWNLVTHPSAASGHYYYSALYQGARAKAAGAPNPKPVRIVHLGKADEEQD